MARLIAVARNEAHIYSRRQMPLNVDENLTMVLQFPEVCLNCEMGNMKKSELEPFTQRFNSLSKDEIAVAMMTTNKDIYNQLTSVIPCVGCRKSVERLFDHLVISGNPSMDPLVINKSHTLTMTRNFLFDSKAMYALFTLHGCKMHEIADNIPKSRKNKRCQLHSLDTQKSKTTANWTEVWDLLSEECKDEILLIGFQKFMEALIVYLDKHRFCSECKTKVLKAYAILIGEDCKKKEKGFCPSLYDGIKACRKEKHIHVKNNAEFIGNLIVRAEPDLMGSRRERHAKTIDIAQEEVLTCVGVYLYEKFSRILQKIRLEEQTWKQLFYLGISCVKKTFEIAIEAKQGVSQLELLCAEMQLEKETKKHKKELKRQKKKKSKQSKKVKEGSPACECTECNIDGEESSCTRDCQRVTGDVQPQEKYEEDGSVCGDCDHNSDAESGSVTSQSPLHIARPHYCGVKASTSDLGYSSGPENCDACSASSASSDTPVLDIYKYTGEGTVEHSCDDTSCTDPSHAGSTNITQQGSASGGQGKFHSTLQDMLDSSDKDDDFISEEDIAAFKANMSISSNERRQLREKLKQQFDSKMLQLCKSCKPGTNCVHHHN